MYNSRDRLEAREENKKEVDDLMIHSVGARRFPSFFDNIVINMRGREEG